MQFFKTNFSKDRQTETTQVNARQTRLLQSMANYLQQ